MSNRPLPIDQIKVPSIDIGIAEGRGQSVRQEKIRLEERRRAWEESPKLWRRVYGRLVIARLRW